MQSVIEQYGIEPIALGVVVCIAVFCVYSFLLLIAFLVFSLIRRFIWPGKTKKE